MLLEALEDSTSSRLTEVGIGAADPLVHPLSAVR